MYPPKAHDQMMKLAMMESFLLKQKARAPEPLSTPAAAAEWTDRARSLVRLALTFLVFGAPGFWTRLLLKV